MIAAVNSSMLLLYTQYLHFALLLFFFFFFFFLDHYITSKLLLPALVSQVFTLQFIHKFVTMTEYVPRNKQRISPCFHNKPRRVGPSALLHDHCLLRLTRERETNERLSTSGNPSASDLYNRRKQSWQQKHQIWQRGEPASEKSADDPA